MKSAELVEFHIRRVGSKKSRKLEMEGPPRPAAVEGKTVARSRISAFEFKQGDSDMNGGKRPGNRRTEGEEGGGRN